MLTTKGGCALAVLLTVVSLGSAAAADSCDAVYVDAVRNSYKETLRNSYYHAVFDHVCTAKGEIRSSVDDVTIGLIYDELDFNFGSKSSDKRQYIETFCRDYKEVRFSDNFRDLDSSTVVVEALANYNICRAIERENVRISHSFVKPDGLIFNFLLMNTTTKFRLEDVITNNFECYTTAANKNGERVKLGGRAYVFDQNFSITCQRMPANTVNAATAASGVTDGVTGGEQDSFFVTLDPEFAKQLSGRRTFSAGSVGIATNLGAYTISMDADEQYPNSLASAATARLEEAAATISRLEGSLATTQERLTSTEEELNRYTMGSSD